MTCQTQKLLIEGAVGELEISLTCPKNNSEPDTYAIVCHPHPLHGGTMDNKVVYMIASTLTMLNVGVVRFNFRGVGKSEGQFDQGDGEVKDLHAVANWLDMTLYPQHIWLAGFSFGSYIALRAHQDLQAERLLLVAPAVQRFDFSKLYTTEIPTLIIQGDQDEVVSPDDVRKWVNAQKIMPQFKELQGVDHFFHGQLKTLRDTIINAWQAS